MRILGLDVGSRRIGVAISDPDGIMAVPLKVVRVTSSEEAMEEICVLLRDYEVQRIVVGLPRSLDGTLGRQAEEVQEFISCLSQRIEMRIDTWDERLSTVSAQRMMREGGKKRGKKVKQEVDDLAAVVILQGYLDKAGR